MGEFETDNPIHNHRVTDETQLVPGDGPSVDKMKAILDEQSECSAVSSCSSRLIIMGSHTEIRYTGFRCYYGT